MNSNPNQQVLEGSPANAAITLLIDLAQQGEIDPWDVDVIKVIDRFFQDLNQLSGQESSLPESGQAFLWASMLVSLKADTLEALGEDNQEESNPDLAVVEEGDPPSRRLPQKLENHIRRRGSAPPAKKRRVTLSELITHLKALASQMEESSEQSQEKSRSRSPSKRETAKMISHLAHNENLTELATELEQFLKQATSWFAHPLDWMSLEQLTAWWAQETDKKDTAIEPAAEKSNRVGVFWALLLLSAQSKVELSQEEFYQDLHLRFILEENQGN